MIMPIMKLMGADQVRQNEPAKIQIWIEPVQYVHLHAHGFAHLKAGEATATP